MFWILAVIASILLIGFYIGKGIWEKENINQRESLSFPIPNWAKTVLILALMFSFIGINFEEIFFYAEPGFKYHVRTILGQERVVDGVGYSLHLYGRKNAWKKAMSVVADLDTKDGVSAESDNSEASASIRPTNITFLDQVDADAFGIARFRLPQDEESFLQLAREYRTPENFLRVSLIPAFLETIQATASLMSAEEYYSGGRTEFLNEFENQLQQGIYLVKRKEVPKKAIKKQIREADASKSQQEAFVDQEKTIFVVEKILNKAGLPKRKIQKFTEFGVSLIEARITNMNPNEKFLERMRLKQKASADRAIAREQKIQEEEQKLLAIAKGEREVAQRQATMKVEQIAITTKAETEKKKTIIEASKLKEEAKIQKEAAAILLQKAEIDAKAVKVTADAEAYRKKKIITADNALTQKIEAEIKIQDRWAKAFENRKVPQYVFGSGGDTPVGSDTEVKNFMKLMIVDAAKRLNYDRSLTAKNK
jgi:hypothetical protein